MGRFRARDGIAVSLGLRGLDTRILDSPAAPGWPTSAQASGQRAPAVVAIDAAPATAAPTGVGVYVRDLATALVALVPERIALIGVRPDGPLSSVARAARASTPFRGGSHQEWLQRHAASDVQRVGATLVHFTNGHAPLRPGRPFVLTVQDLSVLRSPRLHPPIRVLTAPLTMLASRRARQVIVPSRATADDLAGMLRVPPARIRVVAHAPSTTMVDGAPVDDGVLDLLGLRGSDFLLTVGTLEPRKNHVRLMAAFEHLAGDRPELRLAVVGRDGWRDRALLRALEAGGRSGRVVRAGYLPDPQLRALFQACAVFVYPSLLEGFGLPVVEAMAAGAPVVTSRGSSLPEAAGGAAVLVDPLDPVAIAEGIGRAMEDRVRLSTLGRQRAASRDWRDVARETLAVYRDVLSPTGQADRAGAR
jgi:glycosyltransferase involved in cell wall biosynthesis